MKPVAAAMWEQSTLRVYLLDDRVEVGRTSMTYSEELTRVAYRDVSSLVTWRSRRPRFLWLGVLLLLLALIDVIAVLSGAPGFVLVFGVPPLLAGAIFLYLGRDGTVLQFRVDGMRGSVHGVLTGSRRKQERVLADLVGRIRERQSVRPEPPPPAAASELPPEPPPAA